jgi:hypothetical protein
MSAVPRRVFTEEGWSMNVLSKDDLTTLREGRPGWHISMFMPMIQTGIGNPTEPHSL